MSPEHTIQLYVQTCVELEGRTDEDIVEAMLRRGCSPKIARDATRYAPIAFSRQFLDGMGITFSDDCLALSANGDIEERGLLSSNPLFVEARRVAPAIMSKQLISSIVFRSSEANAVNDALNAGSKPSNLRLGPVLLFNGQPTEKGAKRAQELVVEFLQTPPPPTTSTQTKPWWKVW